MRAEEKSAEAVLAEKSGNADGAKGRRTNERSWREDWMVQRDQIRRELQLRQPPARVLTAEAVQPQRAEGDGLMTQIRVLSDRTRSSGGVSSAGFNRRMRKTARTVVWESDGAQTPSLDPISNRGQMSELQRRYSC